MIDRLSIWQHVKESEPHHAFRKRKGLKGTCMLLNTECNFDWSMAGTRGNCTHCNFAKHFLEKNLDLEY